jgi:alpha,alpha-trehalase
MAHYSAPFGVEPGTLYRHIRAACESGWDFLADGSEMSIIGNYSYTDIVPVDLNASCTGLN